MRKLTQATYLAAAIAMVLVPLGAQQGCGGDETTDEPNGPACPGTQTLCGSLCVDTTSDASNCGTCGNTCRADMECANSNCQCPAGRLDCGTSCSLVMTDPTNCGECGNVCNEVQTCINGDCQCPGGQQLCGDSCADTETDKQHCGDCDTVCPAAQDCVGGDCVCADAKTLCGEQCVDTQTDARFCGNCTTACDAGEFCDVGECATINTCADVPNDSYENNETCEAFRELTVAPEGGGVITVGDATLHHQDASADVDWFHITATEGTHICSPFSAQCYFVFSIAFTPPTGADHTQYQMCVYDGDCDDLTEYCATVADHWNATEQRYEMALQYEGTCTLNDDFEPYVKISRSGGTQSCTPYKLEYQFDFTDEECAP